MNIYLLQLVGKWLSILVISIASFMGNIIIQTEKLIANNISKDKNTNIINEIVEFDTVVKYNAKMPSNRTKVLLEGEDGVINKDSEGNIVEVLKESVSEVVEVGTGAYGDYIGRMTGYGPDCYGCSKVGNVACLTESKTKHSLISNGIYYNDDEYGQMRILAADHSVFPCGTIIKVSNTRFDDFYGVVLDTGGAMRYAWRENSEILIDLAFTTQKDPQVNNATSKNVLYEVQRWGW